MNSSCKPDPSSGLNLYRFEFDRIPLDAVAINSESVDSAIESFKIMFGESSWRCLEGHLLSIHKIY